MRINPSNSFLSGVRNRLITYRHQLAKLKQKQPGRIIAVCAMVIFCLVGLSSLIMRRAQAAGNVTGTVFQDFNGNTVKDTVDPGLGGITVTAYNAAGTVVASATSSSTVATLGQYTLNLSAVANGTALRIEFTGAASYLHPGPQGDAAGESGSSVQFVTTSAGGLTNLNYGVNNPGNYCQANPRLATSSYAQGDQAGLIRTTVVSTTYTASGNSTSNYLSESQAQQTGSTWGLAYHRTSNTLFSAAYIKRNAGLAPTAQHPGSDGTGAIYRTTVGGSVDGTIFVDLDVLFSNAALTGANPHTDFDPNPPDFDSGAYGAVGKIALGGLAVSEDDQTLYAINLVDRRMYKLPIGLTPTAPAVGAVTSYLVPNPGCTNGVGRPFAVKTHNGLVYVGGVCTAENAGGTAANLSAYVYSFDPSGNTWSASPVLSFALNYTRGCADIGGYPSGGCRAGVAAGSFADWRPWRDTLDLTFPAGYGGGFVAHPQAMLANIEFIQNSNTGGEDLVIALRDRFADQIGNNDPGPTGDEPTAPPANGSALNATPAGEILRASLNASNVWVIEQNSHNASGAGAFGPAGGANNNQGPVSTSGADSGQSGEFYLDNHPTNHDEIACGGLAFVPGNAELAATIVDPVALFSGGTTQFLNTTGVRNRSYEINLGSGGFQKADSFSDLEAICNAAPIELGNRVWNDANGNGVQDPGEAVLSGIAVRLLDSTGATTLSTATTDTNGNYLFSSASGTSTASVIYNLSTLDAGTTYQLRIDTAQAGLSGLTTTRQNGDASANGDLRDSDAAQSGNQSIISLTTGGPGSNNHSYDFGFASTYSVGNRVWFDTNNNGQMETSGTPEVGVDGVAVELVDSFGTVLQSQSTTGGGYYRFDNVIPGTYTVRIAASNFTGAGALVGYQNSTGATVGTDRRDNGVDASNPSTAGISSAAITVSASMPASEPDVTGSGIGAHGPRGDATDNLLIDFGFYRITLGNLCFNDSNNNGLFGGADVGLVNCTLRIYQSNGTTEVPVGPDGILGTPDDTTGATNRLITVAGGAYTFSGLTPGAYVVKATPTAGFRSANFTAGTSTPDGNIDNDDNGLGTATGQASSAPITLSAGGEPTVTNATATTTNTTLDFGFTTAAPTAVKLASFSAKTDGSDTLITWRSGFEVSNLGYVLYREDATGGRVQITPSLVAGSALVVGLQTRMEAGLGFAWWDRGNQIAGARYWLEAVDLDGSRETFGPFGVERDALPFARPRAAKLLNELGSNDEFRIEREFPASSVPSNARNPRGPRGVSPMVEALSSGAASTQFELAADPEAVKLLVTQNGWYRVNRADLVAAGFPAGAVNGNLQLFRNGVEVPIVVSDVDGSVQFYGQALDTLESGTNIYWLREGRFPGQRIPFQAQDSVPGPSAQNYRMTVERRDRIVYFSALLNGEGNNFFGPVLGVNPVSQAVNVRYVDQTPGGTATLEVSAVGLTLQAHQLQVKLNGTTVGVISYSHREQPVWSTQVDIGLVQEGENVVTLQSIGAGSDVSLTEHVSLTYPRVYRAETGTADVTIGAGQTLRVDGLRNGPVQVWDITDPNQPRGMQITPTNVNGRFTLYLPPTGADRHLMALASNATPLAPAGIRSNHASELNADDISGRQLVVIAPRELQAGLTPLLELRQSQGINSVVVDIEDVFDEFSYGIHASSAVRAYLSHIQAGSAGRPEYVLLVGDSSFDPRNYLHQGENDLVPTRLVETELMETASDDWFVDFNNDSLPDAAIGRFPVRTPQELTTVVSKLLTYENMPAESQRRAVMVSDTEFVAASQMVAASLPAGTMVTAVERGSDSDAVLRQRLLDGLNSGPSIVNFTGHGQMNVWTGGGLFTVDDPATLTNERPSVYVMLSCLNNFWHDANHESIGEALLKSPHAAVAVWGSSGTTYSDPQVVMALDLYGRYSSVPGVRIGDAIRQAKVATYSVDVRRTWVLFGDPTMRLR